MFSGATAGISPPNCFGSRDGWATELAARGRISARSGRSRMAASRFKQNGQHQRSRLQPSTVDMTISKKGSRPLIVDGISYRWSVRPRPTYAQAICQGALTFAVVNDASPASTLVVSLDALRPDNWFHAPGASVTPNVVARAVREALAKGWRPGQPGRPFALQMSLAK